MFQRIGGVDSSDLPPLCARFVEATRLAVSGGQEHTRGVCLGGAEDPPLENVFGFLVSLQLIIGLSLKVQPPCHKGFSAIARSK